MISSEKVQNVLDMIFGDGTDNTAEAIAERSRVRLREKLSRVADEERRLSGVPSARDAEIDLFAA